MLSASRTLRVYCCKLTKRDLDALWRIATRGCSERVHCAVSTERGITKVEAASPDDLIVELGDPDQLSKLTIHVHDYVEESGDGARRIKSVHLSIDSASAYVSVSGPDETWVRGRAQELEELLRGTQVRFTLRARSAQAEAFLIGALTGVSLLVCGLLLAMFTVSAFIERSASAAVVWGLSLLAYLGISFALVRWNGRRSVTEIVLTEPGRHPWNRNDRIAVGAAVIGGLALIAAVAQILLSAHTGGT